MKITLTLKINGEEMNGSPYSHTVTTNALGNATPGEMDHLCHSLRYLFNQQAAAVENAFGVSFEMAIHALAKRKAEIEEQGSKFAAAMKEEATKTT